MVASHWDKQAVLEGRALSVSLREPEAVLRHVCVLCKVFKVSKLLSSTRFPWVPKQGLEQTHFLVLPRCQRKDVQGLQPEERKDDKDGVCLDKGAWSLTRYKRASNHSSWVK